MSLEKITDPRRMRHWLGHMETDYRYTLGIAGERFLNEIKENARIMGARCKRCGVIYVPPKMYCEECFEKLEEWIDLGTRGEVYTYTIAYVDMDGNRLAEPVIYALITFGDAYGGLIHKLGEVKPEEVWIGMPVEAVFKPPQERKGSITDIKYFKPAQ
ncbi:MAG TPA: Zn-ribbon domain-containing OB-fold protein [Candidatus Bathyarchaeota archaeon]|nr:MAG: nucleic acid-binding protein [Candidatus Bathyarchaeota archaeon]HDI06894.1 Zn-ribbon domain-containing OB-fold protein [Candidatus Bathyarchaeota archaeon]